MRQAASSAGSTVSRATTRRWSMKAFQRKQPVLRSLLCGVGLFVVAGATGCQVDVGGMTLPSAFYLKDDLQYFPPGPEFKLSREAAQMKMYNEEAAQRAR